MQGRRAGSIGVAFVVAMMVPLLGGGAASATTHRARTAPLGAAVSNAGVALQPPSGWTVRQVANPLGLVVAARAADVDATSPTAPRFSAMPVTAAAAGEELIAALNRAPLLGSVKTSKTEVDGKQAAVLEWTVRARGDARTTRFVAVPLGPGRSYTFTFEGPQKQFKHARPTFDAVLASVHFDVPAVPAAP